MNKPENTNITKNENGDSSYGVSRKFVKQVLSLLEKDDKESVQSLIKDLHFADVAELINVFSSDNRKLFIEAIRREFDPEILTELESDIKEEVLEILGTLSGAKAIQELETDDAVEFIEDLNAEEQQEILEAMPKKQRLELEQSLAYPEDSAGRLTDKNIVSVPEFWTVGQTIDFLRSERNMIDEFYQIFILDPKMHPVGGVMPSQILRSHRNTMMKNIMSTDIKILKAATDQEDVALLFRKYALSSAPVVDKENRTIGVITIDDIVDVIDEEAEEDILHLGGITTGDDLRSGFSQTMRQRFPWLFVNLMTAILASVVIGFFEGTIEKLAALAVLMPIAASMGGNAGTQTLTIAVRAIATKDLTSTNALRVIGKEIMVGSLNGLVFAIITGVIAYTWYGSLFLSFIFACSMMMTLFIASMAGTLIPIGLVRIGVDPAIASSVVLTTITDIVAFGVFLSLASQFLV